MIVRAPATSANIGAGFDTAAVAFDLWNELEVTDGTGVVVEGEGAAELSADARQPRRPRVRAARRSGREAVPLRQQDPARARARLVRGRDRARARRRGAGRERRGAARGRAHARAARRQPRRGAARRPDARLGRKDRPDRGEAPARRDRRHPERPNVDQGVSRGLARHGPARRGGRERRSGCPARGRSGERRCSAVRGRARRLAPRALPPVRGARRRPRELRRRAAPGRRSRARARR